MTIFSKNAQGTEEWMAERTGLPTASKFDMVITSKGEPSKQAQKYIYQLAGEIVTGKKEETYQNDAMLRGIELESEARTLYEVVTGEVVTEVGIAYPDEKKTIGASSDGLVGDDGMVEIKCPQMATQVEYLVNGKVPTKYIAQVQGQMYVTGRKWVDFVSYYPGMELVLIRVDRDEKFIKNLDSELCDLLLGLEKVVKKIRREDD